MIHNDVDTEFKDLVTAWQVIESLMPNLFSSSNKHIHYPEQGKTSNTSEVEKEKEPPLVTQSNTDTPGTASDRVDSMESPAQGSSSKEVSREARWSLLLLWPPDLFAFTSAIFSATGAYHTVVSPPSYEFIEDMRADLRELFGRESEEEFLERLLTVFNIKSTGGTRARVVLENWRDHFYWPPRYNLASVSLLESEANKESLASFSLGSILGGEQSTAADESDFSDWQSLVRQTALEWRYKIQEEFGSTGGSKGLLHLLHDSAAHWSSLEKIVPFVKIGPDPQGSDWSTNIAPKNLIHIAQLFLAIMTDSPNGTDSIFDLLCDQRWNGRAELEKVKQQSSNDSSSGPADSGYSVEIGSSSTSGIKPKPFPRPLDEPHADDLAANGPSHSIDPSPAASSHGTEVQPRLNGDQEEAVKKCLAWATNRINHIVGLHALLTLHAIADEASTGFGVRSMELRKVDLPNEEDKKAEAFAKHIEKLTRTSLGRNPAESCTDIWSPVDPAPEGTTSTSSALLLRQIGDRMRTEGTLSTINPQHCRILPKRHTPDVGITLRSISGNLGFHRSSVDVQWRNPHPTASNPLEQRLKEGESRSTKGAGHSSHSEADRISILLLPWPMEVSARDFREVSRSTANPPKGSGHFIYQPVRRDFTDERVRAAIRGALHETSSVDMVILPETALDRDEVQVLESAISSGCQYPEGGSSMAPPVSAYIAGVRDDTHLARDGFGDNMVYLKIGKSTATHDNTLSFHQTPKDLDASIQYKHHKWKLDSRQVVAYGLGHALSPNHDWWEAIKIRRRRVTFMNIGERITVCPLICEDLARQDPISDLLRTAGPTLVVTILMDGPQIRSRWSGSYAMVLAEDPGCAVITLTSAGMVNRWKPEHSPGGSNIVGHWKDGKGTSLELPLAPGAVGILLSVSVEQNLERTADGRTEVYPTSSLRLGAVHQVYDDRQC